jgi:hypothetical protein
MKTIYTIILFISFALAASGQDSLARQEIHQERSRMRIAVQIGTDIGGCVPFPFKYIPQTFNPYPKLNISLGSKLTFPLKDQWSLGTEITYKTVELNADARVKNQRFREKEHIQYFTGSAEMSMEFTMLEIPVYAKYSFKNDKDRIIAGPYFAWILKSSFVTDPKKGFIGTAAPDEVDADMPEDMEDMNFSGALDSWDMGIVVGYERKIYSRFELGLRFMWGFKDIFKPDNQYFDYSMHHMKGSLVLGYNLFNIKSK